MRNSCGATFTFSWAMFSLFSIGAMLFNSALPIGAQDRFDIINAKGKISDGSGNPAFYGDVAIRGDTMAAVGMIPNASAEVVLDARGLSVAPGFIDIHSHGR